ncbi:MAG: extracellular solute-binding protein [Chloroflexi bacterium]|nr:extracellular solute-binding protein [Chloroflexota bacterium]MCY4247078.1 extracellular solute-binding protein [Chloroflexota bacterium]
MKRLQLLLALMAMLVVLLAPAQAQEPVTITYWTDPALAQPISLPQFTELAAFENWQAEQFMAMHPHVTVEVRGLDWPDLATVVPTALAAGEPPDILKDYLGRTSGYGVEGVTVDLFSLVSQEEIDDLLPGLVELYTIDGALHAMPTYFWNHAMIVNKALFDQAGLGDMVPVDDRAWSMDEFYQAATAIKAAGIGVDFPYTLQVASEQGDYDFHAFIWGAGGEIWNADCTTGFDNPKTLAGLEFVNQLYQEGLINSDATTAAYADQVNNLFTGKSAIMGGGMGVLNNRIGNGMRDGEVTVDMDPVVVTYPHGEGEAPGLGVGPTGFAVFDKGRSAYEMEWIAEFLLFLNSTEAQITYTQNNSQFPARASAGVPLADDANYALTLSLIQERGTENLGLACPGFYEVRISQPPHWQAMFLGQETPQQALEALNAEAEFILDM